MRISSKGRKAISPVLATVILIAITLIAAVAIAGFVFGLFGSFTSSAQVSAHVSSCSIAGKDCVLTLTNTGTSNVATSATGCTIQSGGASVTGAVTLGGTIPAGGSLVGVTCTLSAGWVAPTVGAQAVGAFSLSNGASVPFSGVWSA